MGYNSRFDGALTPSKQIPAELAGIINGMDLNIRVHKGNEEDSCANGDVGDVVPWSYEMHGHNIKEDILRVQRLLDERKTGITLSGEIFRQGDDPGDLEKIEVVKGKVYSRGGEVVYGRRRKVSLDRWSVRVLTRLKSSPGKWKTCGWVITEGCPARTAVAWSQSDTPPWTAARFGSENEARTAASAHTDKTHKCEVVKTEVLR